jgi:PAS domain S-box-containing protein
LNRAADLSPDLILLDVMMPGMDGFEVCRRLRASDQLAEVPIILVTALDDRDSRIQGMEAGADDFVTKPIDRVELRARVRTVTRLNRYRRLLAERTQRQQAEEETRRRNRELSILNRVIVTAASTLDAEEALHTACEALAYAFDLPLVTATLLNEARTHCMIVAEYPFIARLQPGRLPLGADHLTSWLSGLGEEVSVAVAPTLEYVLAHRAPLVATDAQSDPRLSSVHALLGEREIVSLASVPILTRDTVAGTIDLCARERRVFSDQDIALAQSVATAASQAMEMAQLYQKLQRHAHDLEGMVIQRTLELQTERDRTRSILEALGEAVVVAGVDGLIQYVNPAAVALSGYTAAEVLGQSWSMWQSDRQPGDLYAQILETIRAGQVWSGEVVNKRKDGTLYTVALTAAPLFDQHVSDQPVGFVSVHRDMTLLKEAERLKDQFVSNVSHELRTPLSVITLLIGNLDALYTQLGEDKRQAMIRDIRAQTRVLSELISDVLEVSRIDSGALSSERQLVNLALLASEEADKQLPLAQKKGQVLWVGGAEHLPVLGSDRQLRQIVRNLLNNAIKYTPEGGRISCECREYRASQAVPSYPEGDDQRLTTSAHDQRLSSGRIIVRPYARRSADMWPGIDDLPEGRWATLRVTDTGVGIDADDLPRIFERFYRVKTQGDIPGTGLGLSIARGLVELHDGQIAVASTRGVGSSFAIYLPLVEDS